VTALDKRLKVPLSELYKSRAFTGLEFERSDELERPAGRMGQQRAVDAIRFGMQTPSKGYNVFVMGPAGSHRHGLTRELLAEHAKTRNVPDDWCYVNNFSDPDRPRALSFPPTSRIRTGRGRCLFRRERVRSSGRICSP